MPGALEHLLVLESEEEKKKGYERKDKKNKEEKDQLYHDFLERHTRPHLVDPSAPNVLDHMWAGGT